ncbi:MAG: D-amino acid aminotransferase [Gammaproteobacteria bacterium]|nr:D-amino acid aminotransferase [Gammaproteobacteria bacterium]
MSPKVYLNGEFVPAEEARVPVLDRGFLFGDGVYELMPVYGGHAFRLDKHLARLSRSLNEVSIPNPYAPARWVQILTDLIERAGGGDLLVYWQVTRGVAPRDHAFPRDIEPTVFAMTSLLPRSAPEQLEGGIKAVTREDIRWQRCDIKSISLLANVLLRQQAIEAGAAESLLVRDGYVAEGAASNVFVVIDDVIVTPPNSASLLPGVTRDLILELAAAGGLAHEEARIRERALGGAQEIWITSSSKEVLPVTTLDEKPVGDGLPGPQWKRIHALYQRYKRQFVVRKTV